MCWWGVAFVLGPNLSATMDPAAGGLRGTRCSRRRCCPLRQQFFHVSVGEVVAQVQRAASVITSEGTETRRSWTSMLTPDDSNDAIDQAC